MKRSKLIFLLVFKMFSDAAISFLQAIGYVIFFLYFFGLAGVWICFNNAQKENRTEKQKENDDIMFWANIYVFIFNLLIWVLTLSFLWLWMIK